MLGLFVSSIESLRGIFVDLVNRADAAPLEWLFDGIYAVGQAAVPLNMIILGCNLSASQFKQKSKTDANDDSSLLSLNTMAAIVVGKMIVMPIIGILSVLLLNAYFWDIPTGNYIHFQFFNLDKLHIYAHNISYYFLYDLIPNAFLSSIDIDASFYLVAMIVFITPTANNVMVMVSYQTERLALLHFIVLISIPCKHIHHHNN
jgi:predicted permease